MNSSQGNAKKIYITVIIIAIILLIIWIIGNIILTEAQYLQASLFSSITISLVAGIAAILFLKLSKSFKLATYEGKILLFLGLGMVCWIIGEIMYAYYEQNGLDPFPSIADVFYLIGYFPFALGLILQTKLTKVKLSIKEKIAIIIVYSIIALIVIYGTIIYPIQEVAPLPEEEFLSYFVSALYPICDLMIVFWSLVVYMKLRSGRLNMAWIMLLLGLSLFVIADILFVWIENVTAFGLILQPFDLMFILAYLAFIISAYNFSTLISKQ